MGLDVRLLKCAFCKNLSVCGDIRKCDEDKKLMEMGKERKEMFWNKKEKEKEALARREQIELYTQIIKELEEVYLPIRNKCVEVIRSHGLNRYPLREVMEFGIMRDEPIYKIIIYNVKEDWWNGEKCLKKTDRLLEEFFRLEAFKKCLKSDHCSIEYDVLGHLEDPTEYFRKMISYLQKQK